MKTVFVGMSGGVDSSVSALLLKEQGYRVVGIYMKNWSQDLPGMKCPWAEDLADAKRVAVKLGIDFEVWDFEKDYREKVVDYMLSEFRAGNTPNPDIMCNQEIKFKLFYEKAMKRGADYIATGHYARIIDGALARAIDENKDQTYFLYRVSEEALAHTIFPIGEMKKPEVKKLAAALHSNRKLKALVLLDPFGMQVDWESIERLKGTGTDLWILIPTGVIVNRLLDRRCKLTHIEKLTSFFGKDEEYLRNYFYNTRQESTLFGDVEVVEKVKEPISNIAELYIQQMKSIFKYATEKPLVLYNTRRMPIFHFACASNNETAVKIAHEIINK